MQRSPFVVLLAVPGRLLSNCGSGPSRWQADACNRAATSIQRLRSELMEIAERLDDIEHRLRQAGRRERQWRLPSAGQVIRAAVIVVSGQAQRSGIIAAETFVVRDANGLGRAQLNMTENEPARTLYDDSGRVRIAVAVEGESEGERPILSFFSSSGNPRAVIRERERQRS